MKPTLGIIVHFTSPFPGRENQEAPAIVIGMGADERVDLVVFGPWPSTGTPQQAVAHDEAKSPGSWHWPEKE